MEFYVVLEFTPRVRTGGELRNNPDDEYYIQATLYKACGK